MSDAIDKWARELAGDLVKAGEAEYGEKRSPVLTHVGKDGSILYAVALENFRSQRTGFLFMHAHHAGEVFRNLQDGKLLKDPHTRVAWIAPAIGVLATLDDHDNVKELVI